MNSVKPPKLEVFDPATGVNIDPKGYVRHVDHYREAPHGLYMARGSDHPNFGYLESWLLPALGLRVNIFHRRADSEYDFDVYIDVADIVRESSGSDCDCPSVWFTRDLYLDVLVSGGSVRVEDADELTEAVAAEVISPTDAALAIDRAWRAVAGIASHHGDVQAWLTTIDIPLEWRDSVDLIDEDAWPHPEVAEPHPGLQRWR